MKCKIEIELPYPYPLVGSVKELPPLLEEAYIALGKIRGIISPYWRYFLEIRNSYKVISFRVEDEYYVDKKKVYINIYVNNDGKLFGEVIARREKNAVRIVSSILLKDSKDPLEDLLQAMEREYNRIKTILHQLTPSLQGNVEVVIK